MDESLWELPDARDGLTRLQRLVLLTLVAAQRELARDMVPMPLLHGRVLEHVDISEQQLRAVLARLSH